MYFKIMFFKIIKKTEHRAFFILLKCRITTFIRHFRLFSKRCPNCNGFKENGKKHSINKCVQTDIKRLKKRLDLN